MRTAAWIAIASAVHGAVLVALLTMPLRRAPAVDPTLPRAGAAETKEIAITFEGEVTSAAPAERAATLPANAEAIRPRSVTSATSAASATSASSEVNAASSASASPVGSSGESTGAPSGGGIVVPIPLSAAELGIGGAGGRNPFLPRAEEKPPERGPEHPAARAMRGTGLAHDRELGLGPEGPAIAALEGATTSSIAPLRGRAHFIVRTGGDGLVSAIDVVDSEGGSGWLDAGKIALEKLRGKKMRIPSGASGMNMHIEVRSEMKLPNGESSPIGGRLGENDMPEMTIPDVSNIGAKPRRVVHARAVGTDVF